MSKLALARVLCDVGAHALKAGQILEADPKLVKQLAADGSVDPNPEAVAYAKSQGAEVVRSAIARAAEQPEIDRAALRVEIAKLQDLADREQDDAATKEALAAELAAKKARLAELG